MRIEILQAAADDLREGALFYERQRAGLGRYFLDTLCNDIDSLCHYAGIHPLYFGYHRMLAKRFPYAVYYRIDGDVTRITAVLDCRRNPISMIKRLNP